MYISRITWYFLNERMHISIRLNLSSAPSAGHSFGFSKNSLQQHYRNDSSKYLINQYILFPTSMRSFWNDKLMFEMLHQTQTVKWSKSSNLLEGHVIDYSYVEAGCICSISKISAVGFLIKARRCSLIASQRDCELWVMTAGFGCFLEPQQQHQDYFRCVINFLMPSLQWILRGSQNSP